MTVFEIFKWTFLYLKPSVNMTTGSYDTFDNPQLRHIIRMAL